MSNELEDIFETGLCKDKSSLITQFGSRIVNVEENVTRNPILSHLEGLTLISHYHRI